MSPFCEYNYLLARGANRFQLAYAEVNIYRIEIENKVFILMYV